MTVDLLSRREFLAAAAAAIPLSAAQGNTIDVDKVRARYHEAEHLLRALVVRLPFCDKPVLATTPGASSWGAALWAETSMLEGLLFARYDPEVALGTHEIFFNTQRPDGLMPAVILAKVPDWLSDHFEFGQIQQMVPIARTAWELSRRLKDEAFLARAYQSCSRFEDWITAHRNTRGTGMVEMFCEFDMGLDNGQPTVEGIHGWCPNHNAANVVRTQGFPLLAPDLSALVYGGRLALSEMAEALGKHQESQRWAQQAEDLRALIVKYCFDREDQFFYDVDTDGKFRKFRGTQLFPLCQEHVLTKEQFRPVWNRYLHNPKEYWVRYPFPSYSIADPHYKPEANAWTGATFLNITIRTLLWMPHYLTPQENQDYMRRWVSGMSNWNSWPTIIDPMTGRGFPGDVWAGLNTVYLTFIEFVDQLGILKA